MAQKDYVSRGGLNKQWKNSNRKKHRAKKIAKTVVVFSVTLLMIFVGGFYFITRHKSADIPPLPHCEPRATNTLPPKPEERWRYIKAFENRQITVQVPTDPSARANVNAQARLTNEQRRILQQMQTNRLEQPTQLLGVPYDSPAKVIRSPAATNSPSTDTPPPWGPAHQPPPPTMISPTPPAAVKVKSTKEGRGNQRWMLQCGAFHTTYQAESMRARLAFDGIESRIGDNGSDIVLGPYSNQADVDKMLQRLKSQGVLNCVPLADGS